MKRIVYFLTLVLLGHIGFAAELRLPDGSTFTLNSSLTSQTFTLTMESNGNLSSKFSIFSQALSPNQGKHEFSFSKKGFLIEPPLEDEMVLFNDQFQNKYHFALRHPIQQDINSTKINSHFLPLEVSQGEKTYQYLLPAFNLPLSFLEESSFYKCENILFSLQTDDKMIDLSLFSAVDPTNAFSVDGKWDNNWRKSDRGFNYGRYRKEKVNDNIKIRINNGRECNFGLSEMEKYQVKPLDMKKYYSFDDIWSWARQIPSKKTQTMEEL